MTPGKIKFSHNPNMEGVFPSPVPSAKAIPDFYKAIKQTMTANPASGTVKRCVPFLDAMTNGYIIPLWADLWVVAKDGHIDLSFPQNLAMSESLGQHSYKQAPGHPMADKPYGQIFLKFVNPWVIETPAGWSCQFTSPFNHLEQRFKLLDGVVDTDTYYSAVNFPFLWTGGDGEFLIPKGTPLVQVTPFKRETLDLEICVTDTAKSDNVKAKLGTHLKHGYRSEFWHKRRDNQ